MIVTDEELEHLLAAAYAQAAQGDGSSANSRAIDEASRRIHYENDGVDYYED